jgi:XTP/dITP diphosphohydrolase
MNNFDLPKQIILATTNPGKVNEFNLALGNLNVSLKSIDCEFNCPETGRTFLENATQKAKLAAQLTGQFCLADDSGLCIEALNKRPGIHSARYFGKGEGLQKVLNEMETQENRKAFFVCALVLVNSTGQLIWQTEQKWHGQIARQVSGNNGFGYDPIFLPEGLNITAAQLEPASKEKVSHRGKAIFELKKFLKD